MDESNLYLVSWDCNGLEACIDVSSFEKDAVWSMLSDKEPSVKIGSIVHQLMMRARFNPQRHYEIYTINVTQGITEEDIRGMFENDPQGSANLIRDRGNKVYSDRATSKVKIV